MTPHAFNAMPFGTQLDADGNAIDSNLTYAKLLTALTLRHVGLDRLRNFFRTTNQRP